MNSLILLLLQLRVMASQSFSVLYAEMISNIGVQLKISTLVNNKTKLKILGIYVKREKL